MALRLQSHYYAQGNLTPVISLALLPKRPPGQALTAVLVGLLETSLQTGVPDA